MDQQENKVISIKRFKEEQQKVEVTPTPVDTSFLEEQKRIIDGAHKQAEAILADAESKASNIRIQLEQEKAEFEQERIHITNEAKQKGFEEGLVEGRSQGYEEMQEFIMAAKQIVENSKQDYHKIIESSDGTILTLGLKVAEKIIGDHLEENPESFSTVVKRALKEARNYREIGLHVNPLYYGILLEQKDELMKIFPRETEFYIYPDADLSERSCIIESANGRIDATVDQQLEEIRRKLFELLESE